MSSLLRTLYSLQFSVQHSNFTLRNFAKKAEIKLVIPWRVGSWLQSVLLRENTCSYKILGTILDIKNFIRILFLFLPHNIFDKFYYFKRGLMIGRTKPLLLWNIMLWFMVSSV